MAQEVGVFLRPFYKTRSTWSIKLLHSLSLVAIGLSMGYVMRHGLQLAGITLLRLFGLNIVWDCLVPIALWPRDERVFPLFFRPQRQSLCTLPVVKGCARGLHSISQPPAQPCFARAIELIAQPKITQILSFSWGFSSKVALCTPFNFICTPWVAISG